MKSQDLTRDLQTLWNGLQSAKDRLASDVVFCKESIKLHEGNPVLGGYFEGRKSSMEKEIIDLTAIQKSISALEKKYDGGLSFPNEEKSKFDKIIEEAEGFGE